MTCEGSSVVATTTQESRARLRPQSETHFWITSKRLFKAISPVTMRRWLQDVILDAGFPGGSTRDVRSVGATTAVQINMDINRVMEATN